MRHCHGAGMLDYFVRHSHLALEGWTISFDIPHPALEGASLAVSVVAFVTLVVCCLGGLLPWWSVALVCLLPWWR